VISAPIIAVEDLAAGLAAEARLLGLDLGTKTIGLALSDVTRNIATPYDTIRRGQFTSDAKTINSIVEQMGVGGLVIGLPISLDGFEGPRAQSTRAFARNLGNHVAVPIAFWDERLSAAVF